MPDPAPPLDFLPATYSASRRKWRWAKLHAAAVVLLGIGLLLGALRVNAELRAARSELSRAETDRDRVRVDQRKLNALRQLRAQLKRQDHALSSAENRIVPSRVLAAVERVTPESVVLTEFVIEPTTRDGARSIVDGLAATRPTRVLDGSTETSIQGNRSPREVKVTLRGLAPDDVSAGSLLAGLNKTSVFKHVNLTYTEDHAATEMGRPFRGFEATFLIKAQMSREIVSATEEAR